MICAWDAYLNLLPIWMRNDVDRLGRDSLQELRLRLDKPPQLIRKDGNLWLERKIIPEDLAFCINAASRYSPWTAATSAQGFLTAQGGHRIGICGETVVQRGEMTGIRTPTSLCLRVARDFPGIAAKAGNLTGSVLIIGRPGSGKTTLLRDLIRHFSNLGCIAVVDERRELFPVFQGKSCFEVGKQTDVITGCNKKQGIEAVLRTMGPARIAVDEITAADDCRALIHAGWCGVQLLATAHAADKGDLFSRSVYKSLVTSRLFDTLLILQPDKSWRAERMDI